MVIAGAGPAGATLARLLALRDVPVTLVHDDRRATDRLEVVAPRALALVAAAGQSDVLADRSIATACLGIRRTWPGGQLQIEEFITAPGGRGTIVDRLKLDAALRRRAAAAGASIAKGRVTGVRITTRGASVRLACGTELDASFVVDATGRRAAVARRWGARRFVSARTVADRVAVAVYSPDPWLRVTWNARSWDYRLTGPGGAHEHWTVAEPGTAPAVRSDGMRQDASSACLDVFCGPYWLSVGDAAISFDPVASQGLAHAMASAIVAAGKLLQSRVMSPVECDAYTAFQRETWVRYERGRGAVYAGETHLAG